MIYQALKLIATELNTYLDSLTEASDDLVLLGNIAMIESKMEAGGGGGGGAAPLEDKILLTLVNIQEENTLKNLPAQRLDSFAKQTEYRNPAVNLNLYILFSVTNNNYQNALLYLSRIISFFQGKRIFTNQNTPVPSATPSIEDMENFRLIMDLYSPNFEETNYLWGTLGGKQFPSVLYKVRLVEIEREDLVKETRGIIKTIQTEATGIQ